jgi:glucosamine kinase
MVMDLEGRELGMAQGPPALVDPSNPGAAAEAISGTAGRAVGKAGLVFPAKGMWAGLAGAGRPGAREAVEIALRSLGLAERVGVGMDVEGAHQDAFGEEAGVLLVVGTGTMAWGRDPDGGEIRVGGGGGILGDEGGGYWIGLQGLRAVARAWDGRGEETLLIDLLLSSLHLRHPQDLIPWIAEAGKREVAALAPLVVKAGEEGDPVAGGVLQGALEELARHLRRVRAHWTSWPPPIPVALVGGLAEEGGPLRGPLEALVGEMGGSLQPGPVLPVRGAARKALELSR